jgi:hypothetical protein
MKTFEGSHIRREPSEFDDPKVVLPMYLLRGVSVTLIILLFVYIFGEMSSMLDPELKFPGFILSNVLIAVTLPISIFLLQAAFYFYQIKRKASMRRSRGEMIMSYALPLIGIIAAVYTAYAVGAM